MSLRNLSVVRLFALVAIVSHLLIAVVEAHGYVTAPHRAPTLQDRTGQRLRRDPVRTPVRRSSKGLPFARNADAKLCSAGLTQFAQLDRQGAKVWPTTKAADVHSFSWTFTAQHATTNFRYFITRPDWDASSTKGLTANDLESDPFLTVAMNGKAPPATMKHDLSKSMPTRTGHHIVYAVWTVDNTANAFYQCIDLDFGGSHSNSNFPDVGSASPQSSSTPKPAAAAPSSSASSSSTSSASNSNSNSAASSSNSSASSASTPASTSKTDHRNHSVKSKSCRLKKRRQPNSSALAARADYRRQPMRMLKKAILLIPSPITSAAGPVLRSFTLTLAPCWFLGARNLRRRSTSHCSRTLVLHGKPWMWLQVRRALPSYSPRRSAAGAGGS